MNKGDTDVSIHKLLYILVASKQMTSGQRGLGNPTETEDSYSNGKSYYMYLKKPQQTMHKVPYCLRTNSEICHETYKDLKWLHFV